MKKRPASKGGESGSALITLLFFAIIITLAAGNIAVMARQSQHMSRIIVDRTAAQKIAEGAATRVLAEIVANPHYIAQLPSSLGNGILGSGDYSVAIENSQSSIFTIVADGEVNGQSRTVRVHVQQPNQFQGMQHAMFSNGDIDISGTGSVTRGTGQGDVHANQDSDMSGNTAISGSIAAVGNASVKGAASVDGQIVSGARPIAFPQLDLDHFYQIAQANNQIHNGNLKLNSSRTPAGGVLWVNGEVDLGGGGAKNAATFTGVLIATGDIKQASHYIHKQDRDKPALISRDGNIHLSGQTQSLEGFVYAKSGRIDITGGSEIHGALVAWGDIKVAGNWGVINYVEPDTDGADGNNKLRVLAWEF